MSIRRPFSQKVSFEKNRSFFASASSFCFSSFSHPFSMYANHFILLMYYVHSFTSSSLTSLSHHCWYGERVNCSIIGFVFGWKTKTLDAIHIGVHMEIFEKCVCSHGSILMRSMCSVYGCECSSSSILPEKVHPKYSLSHSQLSTLRAFAMEMQTHTRIYTVNCDHIMRIQLTEYAHCTFHIDIVRFYCSVIVILVRFDCVSRWICRITAMQSVRFPP